MTSSVGHLELVQTGNVPRIRLQGRVAAADLPALKATVERVAGELVGPGLVVDLHGVPMIDSAALGFLISTFKMLRGHGRGIALVGVVPGCLETLRVTNLTRILPVFENTDEALRALGG